MSLAQLLTVLATDPDSLARFLAAPASFAGHCLSPTAAEALLSGDEQRLHQALAREAAGQVPGHVHVSGSAAPAVPQPGETELTSLSLAIVAAVLTQCESGDDRDV